MLIQKIIQMPINLTGIWIFSYYLRPKPTLIKAQQSLKAGQRIERLHYVCLSITYANGTR